MKKLNKLQFNSEKIMKNKELTTLRGGYSINCCVCTNGAHMIAGSPKDCETDCLEIGQHGVWQC